MLSHWFGEEIDEFICFYFRLVMTWPKKQQTEHLQMQVKSVFCGFFLSKLVNLVSDNFRNGQIVVSDKVKS